MRVARASRSPKLEGRPVLVRLLPALALAAGERRAGATGSTGVSGVVSKEQLGKPLLHLEAHGVGEHAEERVAADAGLEPMEDRTEGKDVRCLHRPEGPLGLRELLVGADDCLRGASSLPRLVRST